MEYMAHLSCFAFVFVLVFFFGVFGNSDLFAVHKVLTFCVHICVLHCLVERHFFVSLYYINLHED